MFCRGPTDPGALGDGIRADDPVESPEPRDGGIGGDGRVGAGVRGDCGLGGVREHQTGAAAVRSKRRSFRLRSLASCLTSSRLTRTFSRHRQVAVFIGRGRLDRSNEGGRLEVKVSSARRLRVARGSRSGQRPGAARGGDADVGPQLRAMREWRSAARGTGPPATG